MVPMRFLHLAIFLLSGLSLVSCATAPAGRPPYSSNAPYAARPDVFARELHLCNGDHIDNALPVDHGKHIIGYRPITRVAGVTLARAPVRRACFSSGFGPRHDRPGRHNGIDLSTGHPHAVYAAGDGVVEEMRAAGGYGNMILIRHGNGVKTRYGHLSSFDAAMHLGHDVKMGEIIGRTGRTGNATAIILHYEIIVDGVPRDPMSVGR